MVYIYLKIYLNIHFITIHYSLLIKYRYKKKKKKHFYFIYLFHYSISFHTENYRYFT